MAKKKTEKINTKKGEKYRQLLLDKRAEILADITVMEESIFQSGGELSSMPVHMADIGSDNFEQEFSLGLMAEEKKILAEIDMALKRFDEGTYGICEGLGIPIEQTRLEAIPWTRYSLEYAKKMEKGRAELHLRQRPLDINREDSDHEPHDDEDVAIEEATPEGGDDEIGMPEETMERLQDEGDDFDDEQIKE